MQQTRHPEQKNIFAGYDNRSKAYRIFTNDGRVILDRTVKFAENNIGNSNAYEN